MKRRHLLIIAAAHLGCCLGIIITALLAGWL
jgi:hypothetical protein